MRTVFFNDFKQNPAAFAALVVASLFAACPAPPKPPSTQLVGDGYSLTDLDGGLSLSRDGREQLRFENEAFQLGTVRGPLDALSSYDPYWLQVNDGVFTPIIPSGLRWRAPTSRSASRDGESLVLSLGYEGGLHATVRFTLADDGHLLLRFVPDGEADGGSAPIAYLRLRARVDASEAFYGLGEWFDSPNHRGQLRPMQLEADLTTESGSTENHVVTPFLFGSTGWGLFVESNRTGVFDVAKTDPTLVDSTWSVADASSDGLTVHLFSAADALDVPQQYFRVTGLPKAPAFWALGPWLWRNENADTAQVLDDLKHLRDLDLATSGMWLDRPYATEVNSFDYDPLKFPDAGAMIDAIHASGLKLALWHTPYLASTAPLRAEADAKGYFPPATGVQLNHWSAPLDFTNPAATAFWSSHLEAYTAHGVEGFKLDFAEDIVAGLSGKAGGWRFFDGSTERTMHAQYTRLYHSTYRAKLNGDGFLLVRSGRWGTQATGVVVWPGDIDATLTRYQQPFEAEGKQLIGVGGLPSAIRAGIGLSLSGFQFAADTGGYRHGPPNKETFMRWVEQSALMPVMQTGDSTSQPPWVFTPENGRDDEALNLYRTFARLHLRLSPYFYSHLQRLAQGTGRPVVRPFGLAFPSLHVFPDEVYTLGDELLVAPVEQAGATSKTFPMPEGRWFSFFTFEALSGTPGAPVTVPAALTQLPLFIREGALVPMLSPTLDTLAPATAAGVESFEGGPQDLWVRVVPGATASQFELFDGALVSQQAMGSTVVLSARAGSTFKQRLVWEVMMSAAPTQVLHGGTALMHYDSVEALNAAATGWSFNSGLVSVKTPLDGLETQLQ